MKWTSAELEEYRKIIRDETGVEMSLSEAEIQASQIYTFFKTLIEK